MRPLFVAVLTAAAAALLSACSGGSKAPVCGAEAPSVDGIQEVSSGALVHNPVQFGVHSIAQAGCGPQATYTYAWWFAARPYGSSAAFTDAAASQPTFTPDKPGSYTLQVAVTSASGKVSAPVSLTVVAQPCGALALEWAAPLAAQFSDPQLPGSLAAPSVGGRVRVSTQLKPDPNAGSCGSYDPGPTTLEWTLVAPAGSKANLGTETVFAPDVVGRYHVSVIATDRLGNRAPAQSLDIDTTTCGTNPLQISVSPASSAAQPIIAFAYDDVALSAAVTSADNTSSCPPRFALRPDALTVQWSAAGASVQPAQGASTMFRASSVGTFTATATATYTDASGVRAGSGSATVYAKPFAVTPLAPTPSAFMFQGQQTAFAAKGGGSCTGRVALGVGDQAVCFTDSQDKLRCAGSIYTTTYGTTFVDAGRTGVDQILIGPTFGAANGNTSCVHQVDGNAWCMGFDNSQGQFGVGDKASRDTWVQWGGASTTGLKAIGSGTWSQICAITRAGGVLCSGNGFGVSPVAQGAGTTHSSFWVNGGGTVALDDPAVQRAGESVTGCQVKSGTLVCLGGTTIAASNVVMGGEVQNFPDCSGSSVACRSVGTPACWLDTSGAVSCQGWGATGSPETRPYFSGHKALAIGLNYYGNNLCAAMTDGSLWCLGSNGTGMLGAGTTSALTTATQVQGPGSVRVDCQ